MPKVRLQHNGKSVSIELDPDGDKIRNHNPLRFRISHDVSVNTGLNTWFMSRKQLEAVQLQVLTEILEAKQPGGEEAIEFAERRVAKGQQDLVRAVQQVGRLTHPDVMMLIDMRQNPNQYVNSSSAFANMFNALARKVMDLSFYATLNGPNPKQQREDFIRTTGAVTRGMDQFIYCRPNASEANPYVNFSVIPAGQNYEDVRFPTHYDVRTQTKEKIPKARFTEIYAFYVNELFDCYRRYLRMLGAVEILPGNTDEVAAAVFARPPGEGPEEGGDDSEAVTEGLRSEEDAEILAEQEARQRAQDAANEAETLEQNRQYDKAARKAAKRETKAKERSKVVKKAVKGALEEFKAAHEAKRAQKGEVPSPTVEQPTEPSPSMVGQPASPEAESSTESSSSSVPTADPQVDTAMGRLVELLKTTGNTPQQVALALTNALPKSLDKDAKKKLRARLTGAAMNEQLVAYNSDGKLALGPKANKKD